MSIIAAIGLAVRAAPSLAGDAVSIVLQGEVDPECRMSGIASVVDLGQITKTGSRVFNFGIHCNSPFRYTLRSQQGGFRNGDHALIRSGFTALIPYSVRVSIPTDAGGVLDICDSTQISGTATTCTTSDSGNGIAIEQTGSLTLSWSIAQEPVAGTFADILTFSVQTLF